MRFWILLTLATPLTLAGCETAKGLFGGPAEVTTVSPDMPVLKPKPRPDSVQEVPVALPVSGDQTLGTTIAALGDPAIPGLWMETPLTRQEQTGTARYGDTTVVLTLKPTGAAAGSGSRLSLLAMQALGAPLTELVEITVVGAR